VRGVALLKQMHLCHPAAHCYVCSCGVLCGRSAGPGVKQATLPTASMWQRVQQGGRCDAKGALNRLTPRERLVVVT
jgi:hypothetical protein